MDSLPDDVLSQILVKLPSSKSILRCTSVCKPWYFLIKSPTFVKLHLSSPDNPKFLFCDFKSSSDCMARYLSIHHDTESFDEHYRLLFPGNLRHGMFIHGCCNGLICYTASYNGLIHIWNPTIRKLKVLPKYRSHGTSCFGFWFDKRVNDHMVAKISTEQGLSVDVYSLSTNSWKTITESIPPRSVAADRDLVYVDGKLHWPAKRSESWMICSLDIETGILGETPISSKKKVSDFYLTSLGECSFAVLGSSREKRCCLVQVYDQKVNNLYTIDLEKDTLYDLQRMVGLRNNGEALFRSLNLDDDDGDLEIISCNTKTKDFKRFVGRIEPHLRTASEEVDGYPCNRSLTPYRVRPFIETLVLLNEGDAEETSAPNYQLTSKSKFSGFMWLHLLFVFLVFVLFNTMFLLFY